MCCFGNGFSSRCSAAEAFVTCKTNKANSRPEARQGGLEGRCLPPDHYTSFSRFENHFNFVARIETLDLSHSHLSNLAAKHTFTVSADSTLSLTEASRPRAPSAQLTVTQTSLFVSLRK
jgi:hypothetical protein